MSHYDRELSIPRRLESWIAARYDHGLLDDLNPKWEDLPVGAFSESGTNVCTTVATIKTRAAQ